MDCSMSMSCQIDQLCKSLTFQLRKISSIRHYLTVEVTKTLVTSLILSRLDYCNSLLVGARSKDICRLQSIQNNAARLILKKKRLAHSRPLLYELHWLPVKNRIEYKIALLCFKCLKGEAPRYLIDMIKVYTPGRALRSSSDPSILEIPKVNTTTFGERSFHVSGPRVWNSLPKSLRSIDGEYNFKKQLKHYLFMKAFYY